MSQSAHAVALKGRALLSRELEEGDVADAAVVDSLNRAVLADMTVEQLRTDAYQQVHAWLNALGLV